MAGKECKHVGHYQITGKPVCCHPLFQLTNPDDPHYTPPECPYACCGGETPAKDCRGYALYPTKNPGCKECEWIRKDYLVTPPWSCKHPDNVGEEESSMFWWGSDTGTVILKSTPDQLNHTRECEMFSQIKREEKP